MSIGPQALMLPDGRRLHLNHGPIDLIIEVWGPERDACYAAAIHRFETILTGLATELPILRTAYSEEMSLLDPVSLRMQDAVSSFAQDFVTPMAAVAGAVADEILACMVQGRDVPKAYVNNGGDIAFHLSDGESFSSLSVGGHIVINSVDPARGIASSGWRGRSHSLGIADTVTVKAETAAKADVAATLIANAVDVPNHPDITRIAAVTLSPDSDLGARLVTTDVGPLPLHDIHKALDAGAERAAHYRHQGLISEAALHLQGHSRTIRSDSPTHSTKDVAHA